jgi:hypothetical protein
MFIPMIKFLKQWNRSNKVGLKSFHLELLTEKVFGSVTMIDSYPKGIFDWMYFVRHWLWGNNFPFMQEPGQSYEFVDDYVYEKASRLRVIRNKLDAALKKAERAYDFYLKGRHISARKVWRSMFGSMFPSPEPLPSKPVLVPPKQLPTVTLRDIFSPQQPPQSLGLLGNIHRNTLIGALADSPPKLSDMPASGISRRTLIGSLTDPRNPFKKR